ncbi:hypothetical protein B0H12DRAFT_1261793 [Mycena haematopus]|nr:hypothetical protein B0H12DRAFT_1261793 [Mycena haematopus]
MLAALQADRVRAAALNAQISDLENSISALRLEQAQVQSRLDSYKYPVLTLPNEIISEIFTHVPPPYPSGAPLLGLLPPTSLTHICRQWREIALSLPSLWRAINPSLDICPDHRPHIFDLWLKRSRSCPLSIEFDGCDGTADEDLPKILASIAAHHTRLEHLELSLFAEDLPFIEDGMPLLRRFHLYVHDEHGITPASFCEVPLLRSVTLNSTTALWVTLPWAQLTCLALNKISMHDCVPILQQIPNLIHCELALCSSPDHGSVITLPSLESLVLKAWPQLVAGPFPGYLEYFITPAIRRLRVPEQFLGDEPIRSLMEYISKSGAKLQEVCITNKGSLVPRNSYHDALQSVSRLSFTDVEDLGIDSNFD